VFTQVPPPPLMSYFKPILNHGHFLQLGTVTPTISPNTLPPIIGCSRSTCLRLHLQSTPEGRLLYYTRVAIKLARVTWDVLPHTATDYVGSFNNASELYAGGGRFETQPPDSQHWYFLAFARPAQQVPNHTSNWTMTASFRIPSHLLFTNHSSFRLQMLVRKTQ